VTRQALLPSRLSGERRIVSPEEFIAIAGPGWREKALLPLCPGCGAELIPCGVHSTLVVSNFRHPEYATCSLSSTPDPRYAHLRPSDWDFTEARHLKARFCEPDNLRQGYAVCHRLCFKRLSTSEFVALCREADRRNVWAYRHMPLEVIPYILVTLCDFLTEAPEQQRAGSARRFSYRFVLQKTKSAGDDIDALWLRPEDCRLQAVFVDSGKPVRGRTVAIYDAEIEKARSGSEAWTGGTVFRKILECCAGTAPPPV